MAWKRTFRAVWVANLVTAIGMMSFLPFFPSHLESLGLEDGGEIAVWAGLLFGAAPLSAAVMSPIWGALGDRFGRRLMALRSMLAITVFVGAMAFARSPWELLVLRLLQGLFSGFVAPSLTLVSVAAPREVQSRVASALQMAMTWGAILGPALGEIVRARWGIPSVYLGVSALSGISALLVLLFAHEDPSTRRKRPGAATAPAGAPRAGALRAIGAMLEDVRELRTSAGLRTAVALSFWLQFGMGATQPLLEIHARDVGSALGWLKPGAGTLFSAAALANLVAAPLWGRYGDRRGPHRALILCALWSAGALALHSLAPTYELLVVARVLLGVAMAGAGPMAFGVAAAETAVERRGGAFGLVFASRTLAVALSAFAGGALAAWLSIRGLFLAGSLAILAWLVLVERRRGLARRDLAAERGHTVATPSPQSLAGAGAESPER